MSTRPRPMSDDAVRALGYEPTRRGWEPVTDEAKAALSAAEDRLAEVRDRPRWRSFVIEGRPQPCIICGQPAEPSSVGTPTCSPACIGKLADIQFSQAEFIDRLHTRADGGGGIEQVRPKPKPKPKRLRLIRNTASLDDALRRVGSPREVLERHGVRMRNRMVWCPLHANERTPAMSLYERTGKARAHCHACGFDGDALDLEAAIAGEDLATTIKRWSG